MAAVAWRYPDEEMAALTRTVAAEKPKLEPAGLSIAALNFGYSLKGDKVRWRPQSVFDDGARVFIAFGPDIEQDELPPLFVIGPEGLPELASYRVQGGTLIVDRLFDEAELRLGSKRVRIVRPKGRSS
jgi:type IV secretion system protein VirB9